MTRVLRAIFVFILIYYVLLGPFIDICDASLSVVHLVNLKAFWVYFLCLNLSWEYSVGYCYVQTSLFCIIQSIYWFRVIFEGWLKNYCHCHLEAYYSV